MDTDELAKKRKLCWWCNKKLYPKKGGGFHHKAIVYQAFTQIIHKQCESEMKSELGIL